MIVDALLASEPVMHFADYVTNPEKYLHLTDSIIELIQMSSDRVSLSHSFPGWYLPFPEPRRGTGDLESYNFKGLV